MGTRSPEDSARVNASRTPDRLPRSTGSVPTSRRSSPLVLRSVRLPTLRHTAYWRPLVPMRGRVTSSRCTFLGDDQVEADSGEGGGGGDAAADRLTALTQAAAIGEFGVLRLAYTLSATYQALPAVVAAARSISPAVRVEQREVVASDMEQALLDGRHDAGVCPQMPVSSGIGRMELGREPLVLAVSERHELAGQSSAPLAAVADERFNLWPREVTPGYHDAVITACRSAGFQPRLGEPATGATVWSAIADGDGVGLVVRSLAVQLPRGVSLVALEPPAPTLGFDLLWAVDSDVPLIDRLRAALRAQ
jgi:DNA-binding transcriptional LysR family regulator